MGTGFASYSQGHFSVLFCPHLRSEILILMLSFTLASHLVESMGYTIRRSQGEREEHLVLTYAHFPPIHGPRFTCSQSSYGNFFLVLVMFLCVLIHTKLEMIMVSHSFLSLFFILSIDYSVLGYTMVNSFLYIHSIFQVFLCPKFEWNRVSSLPCLMISFFIL